MIIGVGVDIVEVARVEALWQENAEGFSRRVFTERELTYCTSRSRPTEHLAARFAVKEAAMKALGTGWAKGIGFSDIEVIRDESGKPSLEFHGEAAKLITRLSVKAAHVSYSHTEHHAMATVILEA